MVKGHLVSPALHLRLTAFTVVLSLCQRLAWPIGMFATGFVRISSALRMHHKAQALDVSLDKRCQPYIGFGMVN